MGIAEAIAIANEGLQGSGPGEVADAPPPAAEEDVPVTDLQTGEEAPAAEARAEPQAAATPSPIAAKHAALLAELRAENAARKARQVERSRTSSHAAELAQARKELAEAKESAALVGQFGAKPVEVLQKLGIPVSQAYRALTDAVIEDDKPVTLTKADLRKMREEIASELKGAAVTPESAELVKGLQSKVQELAQRAQLAEAERHTAAFKNILALPDYEDVADAYGEEKLLAWGVQIVRQHEDAGERWTPESVAAEIKASHSAWEDSRKERAQRRRGANEGAGKQPPAAVISGPAGATGRKPSTTLTNALASQTSAAASSEKLSQEQRMARLAAEIDAGDRARLR